MDTTLLCQEIYLNNQWVFYKELVPIRDKKFQNYIHGIIKEDGKYLFSKPKGIPDDISIITKYYYKIYEKKFHFNATWFNMDEIKLMVNIYRKEFEEYDLFNDIGIKTCSLIFGFDIFKHMKSLNDMNITDIRIISWNC